MTRLHLVGLALASMLGAVVGVACSDRTGDYPQDFTAEVERLCSVYCAKNLECREPPAFSSIDECDEACSTLDWVYDDTTCGQARRDMIECVGAQPTCELFMDTYDVWADEYICQAEKEFFVSLECGRTNGQTP